MLATWTCCIGDSCWDGLALFCRSFFFNRSSRASGGFLTCFYRGYGSFIGYAFDIVDGQESSYREFAVHTRTTPCSLGLSFIRCKITTSSRWTNPRKSGTSRALGIFGLERSFLTDAQRALRKARGCRPVTVGNDQPHRSSCHTTSTSLIDALSLMICLLDPSNGNDGMRLHGADRSRRSGHTRAYSARRARLSIKFSRQERPGRCPALWISKKGRSGLENESRAADGA